MRAKLPARAFQLSVVIATGFLAAVAAQVTAPSQAILSVTPTTLSFTAAVSVQSDIQYVQVRNTGKGPLRWSVVVPAASSWILVSPTSGTNQGTLSVRSKAMAAGVYTGSFSVQSNGGSRTVAVTATVAAVEPPPDAPDPPEAPSVYGPQPTITCPATAVFIAPGASIQTAVNGNVGATTFCLRAGVHPVLAPITPKTGNSFTGEYGAVLDGSGWATTDPYTGVFRAHAPEIINDVTIRNLIIQRAHRAIHVMGSSARWTVEHCEIRENHSGVLASNGGVVRRNYIHHNIWNPTSPIPGERGGGYGSYRTVGATFEANEIAYNGPEQKVLITSRLTFRDNVVHHNMNDGIWYDADNTDGLIEGNTVEDNGRHGVHYEISASGTIRTNTFRRNDASGVLVSTSKQVSLSNNTFEDNYRAIHYFVNCGLVGQGAIAWDLADSASTTNTVRVGTRTGSLATALTYYNCTSTQSAPYVAGQKNLTFQSNIYSVPSVGRWWSWGAAKTWSEWQALGHDTLGSVQ